MRVDSKPGLAGTYPTARKRTVSSPGFAIEGGEEANRSSSAAPASALGDVAALLALQGQDDPADRRRRNVRRGHALLDSLDRLKAALLSGRVSRGDLAGLVRALGVRGEATGDPALDEILAHVELRARVEIAKLGREQTDLRG